MSDVAQERSSGRRGTGQKWFRWVHVYTSMISLVLVLFFGLTGLTLNHPDWTFGDAATTTTKSGNMSFDVARNSTVDYLRVSEFLRNKYGISADVSDYSTTGDQGSISYRAPGYSADATFSVSTGAYRLTVEQQGFVAVMNDLHKGRDADGSWKWVIDVVAGFLVLISLTGLGLQLFLRRRRRSAVLVALGGAVIAVVFALLTL
ncbi:MAG: PepSY-associated TM helix domain-containing protein [Acidimicrobiales bacterium]